MVRTISSSESVRVANDVAAAGPHVGVPARARALAVARRVEAQAGDHRVRVTGVRVDRDPLALAGGAPALESRRVERLVEEAAAVQGVAHGARAVIARVLPAAVTTAVLVRLVGDLVRRGDRVLDLLRSAVGRYRGAAVRGDRGLLGRVAGGGVVALATAAVPHHVAVERGLAREALFGGRGA